MGNEQLNHTKPGLVRRLGLFDSVMIMVGIVVASGIFVTTGIMAKTIPSAGLILLAWLVGGLLTLAGALTFAELGAALPEAGGQYVYLHKAYGPLSGFLYGWVMFLVYNSGGVAAVAAAFSEYFGYLFPIFSADKMIWSSSVISLTVGKLIGIIIILVLSLLNYLGLVLGKTIQNIFSMVKICAISGLIVLGFILGKGNAVDFSLNPMGMSFGSLMVGFGVALIAVSWAFDGWNNVNWVAGEIKNPKRTLPIALILGTLGITALYLAMNYLYLYALPMGELVGVIRVAEKATTALLGASTGLIISAAVVISTFSSMNGSILTGPRVYYAMAMDGLFFRSVSRVSPRFRTPGFGLLVQAVWICILVLSGTFEQLITFAMFTSIMFWIAATASVFTLRRKYPDLSRPYKTWGYPVVPALFIVASAGILINTIIEKPVESLAGIGLTLLGIPVYLFWKKRASEEHRSGADSTRVKK
jgi:APA family basic amino acid/polyamine antiporter